MKSLVEFPLEEGGSILVQTDEPESDGTVHAGREETIERARETSEDALNRDLPAAKSVVEKLQSMGSRPDEVEVNFGINLITQASAFLASATAEANFGMMVRWTVASKEMVPAEDGKKPSPILTRAERYFTIRADSPLQCIILSDRTIYRVLSRGAQEVRYAGVT